MSVDNPADEIISLIDRERLKQTTYEFVKIESPTGEEGDFLRFYGKYLEDIGIEVQWDHEFLHAPSVIAKIEGKAGFSIRWTWRHHTRRFSTSGY